MNKNQTIILVIGIVLTLFISLLVSFDYLPKNSILISAIIIGIVLTIFIRKFGQENLKQNKKESETESQDQFSRFKHIIYITRILSLLSAILTLIIISDIILPEGKVDTAIVYLKNISISDKDSTYYIYASEIYKYKESSSIDLYENVQIGDTLLVYLSKNFMEWKRVEVFRRNKPIFVSQGGDIHYMGAFGIAFLLPLFSLLNPRKWFKKFYYWIPSSILIILSMVFWTLLILKWTGSIEKF